MSLTVLALGCGRKQTPPDYFTPAALKVYGEVTLLGLDADPSVQPAIVCRLGLDPIPLPDDSVDAIVANHILEHIGKAGDTTEWFQVWEEMFRVLKPQGLLHFECPYHSSMWAWADPTHVRAISEMTFLYFNQDAYRERDSAIPRFRIKADFGFLGTPQGPAWECYPDVGNPAVMAKEPVSHIRGTLVARKPLRAWWED